MRHMKNRSIMMSFGARSTTYVLNFRGMFMVDILPDFRFPIEGNSCIYRCYKISTGFANPKVSEHGTCLIL